MATTGTNTISFGSTPTQRAVVTVIGQAGIVPTSLVEAFLMADTTDDHNAYEHQMVAQDVGLTCGNIVTGVGFDIVAVSSWLLTGTFTIHYVWT